MSDDAFFEELQTDFLHEAADLLRRVEALSLELERDPDSTDTYAELARLAHNFKGSGKAVGFEHISKLGHRIEDFILALKNKLIPAAAENVDFLLQCLDRLKSDIETLISDKKAVLNHDALFAEIERRLTGGPAVATTPAPDVIRPTRSAPKSEKAPAKSTGPVEVLRIQKPKIDFLLEAFGEQVILQSTLEQCKFDLEAHREVVIKTISQLTKLTFELQSHALSLTMVQIAPTFVKLERAIRDAARMCGKKVEVKLEGGDTEVDKILIDSLSDSLTHMVRNSVDHAIESADERKQKSKSEHGTVWVRARRTGGQLWLEIEDDGKGLDHEVIKQKALSKGLIDEAAAKSMSKEEAYKLIFLNGFSTKENVSEVSGRGVGMNVVQEAVADLKGAIEIQSEVGRGTMFRLKLPLTLAIFNGAVVRVHQHRFVVPSSEISEIVRLSSTQVHEGTSSIRIRDDVFQMIDLRRHFSGIPEASRSKFKDTPLLLTRKWGNKAFVVDEVLGMQKVVQKPLGDEVKAQPEYAAGTILSDGTPGVVLNLHTVVAAS